MTRRSPRCSPRYSQYALLWHAAIAQAHPRAHAILLWSMALMTLLTTTVVALVAGVQEAIGWALCTPAGVVLFAWTMCLVPGATGLNSPANAKLVPGMRARLIELTLLVWLGAIGVFTIGLFMLRDGLAPALLLAIGVTLGVASGVAGARGSWILITPLLAGSIMSRLAPAWLLDALATPAAAALVVASMPPLGVLVTRALLPQAGDRHWNMLAHRERMLGACNKGMVPDGLLGHAWDGLMLRRDLAHRAPRALLMRALGPNLVPLTVAAAAIGGLTFAGLTYLGESSGSGEVAGKLVASSPGMTALILMTFLFQAGSVPALVARNSGEQALVRLAPAMPGLAPQLNRLLARGLLVRGVTCWALTSAAALLLALMVGARGEALAAQACMCCMALPSLALGLRDHARAPSWSIAFVWLLAIGVALIGPLVGALLYLVFGLPFWLCATVAAIVLAAALVRQRLRLVERAPWALPAARLD